MTYKVENFALRDKIVETVHDLFNTGGIIPPMQIQNVDVVRAQFLQRSFYRYM